jgi:hypothetical protein
MTQQATRIPLRRPLDRSRRRKPLRLGISRHVTGRRDGQDDYVTQVRLGRKRAVLVPLNLATAAPPDLP